VTLLDPALARNLDDAPFIDWRASRAMACDFPSAPTCDQLIRGSTRCGCLLAWPAHHPLCPKARRNP
jgi:hypothetical protein